ncbi:MAG: alpha/beta hydrolase-fold protein [Myxococcota bacterium]|nr:alpha/beta hydrolase-fold protein [Myxococcota bacterium]
MQRRRELEPSIARARARVVLSVLLLAATGCSCAGRSSEVRWPASAEGVGMGRALATTARDEGRGPPLSPRGRAILREELPPDAPGIRARSFVFEGIWVAELELGEAPDGAELPLVAIFHGRGDRPRIPGGPFGRVPTPMRVIIPRGPFEIGGGFAWARSSVTQDRHEELAADLVAITDRLVRLIEHVQRVRPTAGSPVVTGFSQGAMVAWTLAVRYPDRIGLAIPMAGWVLPANRPRSLRAPPTRAMHGTADPIVRIGPTREWVQLLLAGGNDVTWIELEGVEHVVTPEMNILFEEWLEEAMRERAPDLAGGLGQPGADPEPMAPYDPPVEIDSDADALPAPLPEELETSEDEPLEEASEDEPFEEETREDEPFEEETREDEPFEEETRDDEPFVEETRDDEATEEEPASPPQP